MDEGIEEGRDFAPTFDAEGLIPAIVMADGDVVMFAYMNREALSLTRETGLAHFWSRSRKALWKKGETSGEMLEVKSIRVDCDQDVLLLDVALKGRGAACHTGRRSCFYRKLTGGKLQYTDETRLFDPAEVYDK
jgi:phosphoribosyl-AMP cyclohydrolase